MIDDLDSVRLQQKGRGRDAAWPYRIPPAGLWDVLKRSAVEFGDDRLTLIAAGATFYLILALFPALAAFVSVYGLIADPNRITEHLSFLAGVMPSDGFDLIVTQLKTLGKANTGALSFGFIFGLLVALWSANNGIKTLFEAMNIVYEEREKRSFVRLNLISLVFTLGAIVVAILLIGAVGVVPAALAFLDVGDQVAALISFLRWPVLLVIAAVAITIIYHFGPSRQHGKWRWQVPGAVLATIVWLIASIGFSWYLQNFANYNATYGSLGAAIGFLMWTWISMVILLVGAEINAELEHQTAIDSTTGKPKPMGERGAHVADTLGKTSKET